MKLSKAKNKKPNFKSRKFSCNFELEPFYFSKHEKYLNRQKSGLETILGEIKNCELAILTNTEKPINKIIKKLLIKLKKNLNYLAEEENAELNYYENINTKKKNILYNQMFIDCRSEQWKNNTNYISGKKINMYNLSSELFFLKTLNFKAENDIKQINNNITKITNDYNYLNLCTKYLSIEEKENLCFHPKYYPLINKILKKQMDDIRSQFELKLYAKNENQNLIQFKNKNNIINKNEGLTNKKEIIKEDSKELYKSVSLNNKKNNNIDNIISTYNKIKKDKKKEKEKYGNYGDNIIIVDTESNYYNDINISDDKISKSNSLSSKISSSIDGNNIINNINIKNIIKPRINLNINFNLHLDEISNYQENMVYNSQRNKNNNDIDNDNNNNIFINNINNIKRKKGLLSSGSLPNFLINSIQEKNIKISSNNENNKNILNDKKSLEKHNSNSKEIFSKEYLITI